MALFSSDNDDRTEPATAFRREEFRKQGKVALSREVASVALLGLVGVTLYASGGHIMAQWEVLSHTFFGFQKMDTLGKADLVRFTQVVMKSWAWACAPLFAVALAAAFLAGVAQVGFYVTSEPLSPNWDRINPIQGLNRLFSTKSVVEALKGFLKLGLGGYLLWKFVLSLEPVAGTLYAREPAETLLLAAQLVGKMFLTLVATFAALAAIDYGFQRWSLEKEMRMTRKEAKDEFKLREGDPLIKSRIRSLQRRMANRRMMDDVPKADVVVTNPTHLAVAIVYDPKEMSAPKVVAKGAGLIAQKIREIARASGVPIVENKPLARAMFKQIDIGAFVPRELYKAVAEVLSYVYRLKGRTAGRAAA